MTKKELLFTTKVLSVPVKVLLVEYSGDEEAVFGQYDSETFEIELNKASSHLHLRITILHELLHVCQDLLGIDNLSHKDVYSLSQALYGILVDNPQFAYWFYDVQPTEGQGQGDGGEIAERIRLNS